MNSQPGALNTNCTLRFWWMRKEDSVHICALLYIKITVRRPRKMRTPSQEREWIAQREGAIERASRGISNLVKAKEVQT